MITVNNSIYCQETASDYSSKETTSGSYGFSLGASFGSLLGESLELVYPVDTMGEFLSELTWEMKPVFYFDLNIEFSRKNIMSAPGFYASASFKAGIPGRAGILENRDWMSAKNDSLTHYSSHTNTLKDFFWADAVIGFSIPVKTWFYITPFVSGSWMRFSFSGKDGSGLYARYYGCAKDCTPFAHAPGCAATSSSLYYPISYYPYNYKFQGEVIRYRQDWFLAAAGLKIGTTVLSPFLLEISFHISPLTYCAAVDEHIGRGVTFNDYTAWGLFIEPVANVSFLTERIVYSLSVSYRYIGNTKGETAYKYESGEYYKSMNESGAGLSLLNLSFTIKYRF